MCSCSFADLPINTTFLYFFAIISLNDFVKFPSIEHLDFVMIEMSISVFD